MIQSFLIWKPTLQLESVRKKPITRKFNLDDVWRSLHPQNWGEIPSQAVHKTLQIWSDPISQQDQNLKVLIERVNQSLILPNQT